MATIYSAASLASWRFYSDAGHTGGIWGKIGRREAIFDCDAKIRQEGGGCESKKSGKHSLMRERTVVEGDA